MGIDGMRRKHGMCGEDSRVNGIGRFRNGNQRTRELIDLLCR